ncbi:MFS transporter [Hippea sp. KM1]|uniref:MFS transporter n=1 Tax=Hippea sp. KM1 TaxID=944481 RepID=UPI00046D6A18|nr:MFS transporter [Hippea sp. KM1]
MDKKKKNYLLGVAHGVFYFASNGFVDYTTVLPTFLKYLINSNSIIGFVAAISRGGSVFFQLLSAFWLQGRRKKPYLVLSLWVRFLSWVMIAASSFVLLPSHPFAQLIVFVVFISLFSFAGGIATIPFYDIISHNIPSELLGRFWAMRQFLGGVLAVGSGYLVKLILNGYGYPQGYRILFVLAALGFGLTSLSLGLMDEGFEKQKTNKSFGDFIRTAVDILKNDTRLTKLVVVEFLSHSIFMCLPFVAIYTTTKLGMPTSKVGYFVSIQMIGSIASNLFWGYFADRKGPRFIIIATNILAFFVPFLSLFFKTPGLFLIVFFIMGAYIHGTFIGYTNYLLKIAPKHNRPTYVSIRGTFNAISYFLPALGGYIADGFSFNTLFAVVSVLSLIALIVSFRLK